MTRPILLLRKLFPKQSIKKLKQNAADSPSQSNTVEFEVVILIPQKNYFALIAVNFDETLQSIQLKQSSLSYEIGLHLKSTEEDSPDDDGLQLFHRYLFDHPSNYWMENVLKPKLQKWMLDALEPSQTDSSFQGSIKMISVEKFCENYNQMKAKYSVPLLDLWSKVEKTDPLKFIFEDISIAAYLVTLWEEERAKQLTTTTEAKVAQNAKQSFIDIGCGNGLLVYILVGEGYTGYGVDLRRRNIWEHFSPQATLIEMTIDPFDEANLTTTLPQVDWMIGNHSDELTPWILFMAACASPTTRAFILPCCPFDFHGHKFQHRAVSGDREKKSQYQAYIDYLQQLGEQFGFRCSRDRLRIPSTKRICLICHGRSYGGGGGDDNDNAKDTIDATLEEEEEKMKAKRRAIVQERLQIGAAQAHRLRPKEETVRNCTRIDADTRQKIIDRLTGELLLQFRNTSTSSEEEALKGLTFQEAISLLDAQLRSEMKQQCGGLQTFIRNHRHIFTIANSRIQLQTAEGLRLKVADRAKNKLCWFFSHHPSGCPHSAEDCAYKH